MEPNEINMRLALTPADRKALFHLRWLVLRKNWHQAEGTERDELDEEIPSLGIFNEAGICLACGRLQDNGGGEGQIRFMAVHPDWQGRGLGKKVLMRLEEEARSMQCKTLVLQARENALDFYLACGFIRQEKTFLLFGEIQHYRMTKELA